MDTQGNTYAIDRIRVALRELCDEDGIVSVIEQYILNA